MVVRSEMQMLEREVHRCRREIDAERLRLDSLMSEKQRLEQAR